MGKKHKIKKYTIILYNNRNYINLLTNTHPHITTMTPMNPPNERKTEET